MSDGRAIITDPFHDIRPRAVVTIVFAACCAAGGAAAVRYARLGLTLSHYDARAHLLVARRVFDSLTPGWRQVGGSWLPLPHLLNLIPVAWDVNYRTGASAVVISIAALALGLACLSRYLLERTHSPLLSVAVPLLVLLNPNVLYLQATPMTEPLLYGASFAALLAVDAWMRDGLARSAMAGWALAALVLTRYEGWLIAAGLLAVAAANVTRPHGLRRWLRLARYPAMAIGAFFVLSWASTGRVLMTSGFFVADNPARHHLIDAVMEVARATKRLSSGGVLALAGIGAITCVVSAIRQRESRLLLPLALGLSAALPVSAFDAGHPFRVRYMIAIVVAASALSGLGWQWLSTRWRGAAAVVLLGTASFAQRPLALDAPMVVEAQRESPWRADREAVTAYLARYYDGSPIMASMDSLGHYMQDTSHIGLSLRDFLHEGNGDLWIDALASPKRHVEWILIEEQAEGGDMLAARVRSDPAFLDGFARVADGGGAALYRRR